jgi:plastocyanin
MKNQRLIALLAIAAVAGLLLAGCTKSAGTTTVSSASTTTGDVTTTAASSQFQVTIDGFAFTPQEFSVPVGSTVTWTNNQATNHTVTSDTGVFDSGSLAQGATFQFTFTEVGGFPYHCSIHASMTAKIVVTG